MATPPGTLPGAACRLPPAPVTDLDGVSYYGDPAFSQPIPELLRADDEAQRPLQEWLRAVQREVARHRQGHQGAAACALEALDAWARVPALLGRFNTQGS